MTTGGGATGAGGAGGAGASGSEGAAPGVSGTSGTKGKPNVVPEAAGENLDTGIYEGAGATGDAPFGTYAGLPTDATGGPPSVGGQIMGAGGIGAGTLGDLPTPSVTGDGGPAGTGSGALGGTNAPQEGMGGNQADQANQSVYAPATGTQGLGPGEPEGGPAAGTQGIDTGGGDGSLTDGPFVGSGTDPFDTSYETGGAPNVPTETGTT